jgi:hypothetical protein
MRAARGKALSGGAAPGGSATGTASDRCRQLSTPTQLRRLLAAVLAATVLFWIAATILQQGIEATAHSAGEVLSPAYQDAVQARAALSDADRAAWQAFGSGMAQQTGPGPQYQNDISNAEQDLDRLAALQAPGSADGSLLQTISGELVTYQGIIEQADASYHTDLALGATGVSGQGLVYLIESSNTLRDQGGLLSSICELAVPGQAPADCELAVLGQQALADQLASPWANRASLLVFAVPVLFTLSGVVAAQTFLRRRFKRAISVPLLMAAAATCGLAGWLAIAIWHTDSAFAAARGGALPSLAAQWRDQTSAVDHEAEALQANTARGVSTSSGGGLNLSATQRARSALDTDLASAENADGLPIAIPVLAAATVAFCYAGFRPRLNEYRAIPDDAGVSIRVLPTGWERR